MSVDPEDFKPKPERCGICQRFNVEPTRYPWEERICDECADAQDEAEAALAKVEGR
jgi:hypothetical protein